MTISVASFALLLLLLILATCVDSRLNSANDDGTKRRISNKKTPNRRRRRTAKEVTLIFPEPPRQPITSVGSESDYNPVPIQYIVGGMTTKPKRYPYFAALYKVIDGKKVSKNVNAMVVPGSGIVKMLAEKEGLDKVFINSGFEWREAGCSMCLAMNPDKLSPQERCASTSNRNFEGRQGKDGRTHLVSPEMAAAAAIEGHFVDVRNWK